MYDILPQEYLIWDRMRKVVRDFADFYNFFRIETTLIEREELMERGFEDDDEMRNRSLVIQERGERFIVRRDPALSVIRAYVEHGLSSVSQPLKVFYEGQIFDKNGFNDAPEFREAHCAGFEVIDGESDPVYDAQIILTLYRILEELKVDGISIGLNTLCCRHCRMGYRKQINEYIKGKKSDLCVQCEKHLTGKPEKILICENEKDKAVREAYPASVDYLCTYCRSNFKNIFEYLEELGLQYSLSPRLKSECGYTTGTLFEIYGADLPYPLASGGRHDYLVESVGGKNTPAVGGVIYLDRVARWLKAKGVTIAPHRAKPKIFLIHIGALARKKALGLIEQLREANVSVWESLGRDALNIQLKLATKMESPLALIFGQKEAFEDSIIIRDMKSGMQETVLLKKVVENIKKRL